MSFYYLATPYSRYHRGIEEAFREAARQAAILTRAGVPVFSPIAHTHPVAHYGNMDPLDHSIWIPVDTPMMQAAEKGLIVCEMEGWRESYGVQKEIEFFQARGRRIVQMIPGIVPEEVRPVQRKVVGLVGYAGAGKDAAARGLVAQLWQRVAFADAVREAVLALNPLIPDGLSVSRIQTLVNSGGWNTAKSSPEVRCLLQRLGTEVGRNILGPNCWVDIARRKIDALPAGQNVVVTDCRFANEVEMIRSLGGQLIYIERPGVGPVNSHVSDAGLAALRDVADHIIVNDGSEQQLQAKLRALCHDSPENVACGA